MTWKIEFDPSAKRDLEKLDPQIARRILRFLQGRIACLENPRDIGEALRGPKLGAFWKYRVGDYRVIAKILDNRLLILIVRIGHRREVYER